MRSSNTNGILDCNSGSFTTGQNQTRSTITSHSPEPHRFFTQNPTNCYDRPVHVYQVDRKGYASIYDDAQPEGGEDQSGKVNPSDPVLLTVKAGGQVLAKGV
jgi:hypothetical protein